MRRAVSVAHRGSWPEGSARAVATLRHDDRHRRRLRLTTDDGEPFLLDLPRPARLTEGDWLACDDGSYLLVRAAAVDERHAVDRYSRLLRRIIYIEDSSGSLTIECQFRSARAMNFDISADGSNLSLALPEGKGTMVLEKA